jgi:hypothetical protein
MLTSIIPLAVKASANENDSFNEVLAFINVSFVDKEKEYFFYNA